MNAMAAVGNERTAALVEKYERAVTLRDKCQAAPELMKRRGRSEEKINAVLGRGWGAVQRTAERLARHIVRRSGWTFDAWFSDPQDDDAPSLVVNGICYAVVTHHVSHDEYEHTILRVPLDWSIRPPAPPTRPAPPAPPAALPKLKVTLPADWSPTDVTVLVDVAGGLGLSAADAVRALMMFGRTAESL